MVYESGKMIPHDANIAKETSRDRMYHEVQFEAIRAVHRGALKNYAVT